MTALHQAQQLAARGLPVFPIVRGTKAKFVEKKWRDGGATTDALAVHDAFSHGEHNIGVYAGGHVVLDVDCKHGRDGPAELTALEAQHGKLPLTYVQRTPSGGLHYFFDAAGEAFGQRNLTPGIDVRATGGYALGAGSEFEGKPYTVEVDAPIAPLPDWMASQLRQSPLKGLAPDVVGELDQEASVECAKRYLTGSAPKAIEYQGGNNTTFEVAARCFDFGLSNATVFELMSNHWNGECSPPWEFEELKKITDSAETNRQKPIGCDNPLHGFTAIEIDTPAPSSFDLFSQSAARWRGKTPKAAPCVVGGYVPQGYVTVIGAAGGRGKTGLALQMMVAVAAGANVLGMPTIEGEAAGIFCEDDDDALHHRVKDICNTAGVDFDKVAERLYPTSAIEFDTVLWSEKDGPTKLMRTIEAQIAKRPRLRLLTIDGASDTFKASENDRTQVTKFMRELTRLAAKYRLAIVLIMHESKSTADDDVSAFAGCTAWFNKARSAIKIQNVDKNTTHKMLLHLKMNVSAKQTPLRCAVMRFSLVPLATSKERDDECRRLTLQMVKDVIGRGDTVSPSKKANNYAGKILPDEQEGRGTDFSKEELLRAVGDLTFDGSLVVETYKQGGRYPKRYAVGTHADPDA